MLSPKKVCRRRLRTPKWYWTYPIRRTLKRTSRSKVPYTIVRSTQFFEFLSGIADQATKDKEVFLSSAKFQPIAADDVASLVTQFALAAPANGIVQIDGPGRSTIAQLVTRYLEHIKDTRKRISTGNYEYYGSPVSEDSQISLGEVKLGVTAFETWLAAQPVKN